MKLAEFLKKERLKRCLTKTEMAELLEVHIVSYIGYEKNGVIPCMRVLKTISEKLKISVNDIYEMIKQQQ